MGKAALGCPVEQGSTAAFPGWKTNRAWLNRTAEGGFPHVFIPSAQVLELNFLTVFPHGGDDVESKGESAPSVLE